eukprot:m.276590 g.276590  ORF g.276590 m.276590 type:complete len:535 (-) comp19768_c0_seq1:168-1772(-)
MAAPLSVSRIPPEPLQLESAQDDKDELLVYLCSYVSPDGGSEDSASHAQGNEDLLHHLGHEDYMLAPECELIAHSQPQEVDCMIDVGKFKFPRSGSMDNPRIVHGFRKQELGRCTQRVSARQIFNEELDEFMEGEGQVWRVLHRRPHVGFPRPRATIEGDSLGSCMSYVVMDYLGTDLLSFVRERGGLSEAYARNIFRQIVSAVAHAVENRIALPQLHLDRIFFTDSTQSAVVIADLHGAAVVKDTTARDLGACTHSALNEYIGEDFSINLPALGRMLEMMLLCDVDSVRPCVNDVSLASFPACISHEASEVFCGLMSDSAPASPESVLETIRDVLSYDWFTVARPETQDVAGSAQLRSVTCDTSPSPSQFSHAVAARLTAISEVGHHLQATDSQGGPAIVYGSTPSGYASVYNRSRRQSVCIEEDDDQIVPAMSGVMDTPPETNSAAGEVSKSEMPVLNRSLTNVDDVFLGSGGPSRNTSGVERDNYVPTSTPSDTARRRVISNARAGQQHHRYHPYKIFAQRRTGAQNLIGQ